MKRSLEYVFSVALSKARWWQGGVSRFRGPLPLGCTQLLQGCKYSTPAFPLSQLRGLFPRVTSDAVTRIFFPVCDSLFQPDDSVKCGNGVDGAGWEGAEEEGEELFVHHWALAYLARGI